MINPTTLHEYENKILQLIDEQDDFTRSDLQGVVSAVVMEIIRETKDAAGKLLDPVTITKAIDAETELPDGMPDEMWESIRNDRDAVTEALRIAVRETKNEIKIRLGLAKRTKQALPTPEKLSASYETIPYKRIELYCRRIEKSNLRKHGRSMSASSMRFPHGTIIENHIETDTVVIRQGWRKILRDAYVISK